MTGLASRYRRCGNSLEEHIHHVHHAISGLRRKDPGPPGRVRPAERDDPGRSAELMTTTPQNGAPPPARLPGPAAEVDASPEGPDVGAFFDLDGTLVAGYTAAAQTRDRL